MAKNNKKEVNYKDLKLTPAQKRLSKEALAMLFKARGIIIKF